MLSWLLSSTQAGNFASIASHRNHKVASALCLTGDCILSSGAGENYSFYRHVSVKALNVITIIVSRMTNRYADTVQMREESESGIRK